MTIHDLLRDAFGFEIPQKDLDEALKWLYAFQQIEIARLKAAIQTELDWARPLYEGTIYTPPAYTLRLGSVIK